VAAFATVFCAEALLFLLAAGFAARVAAPSEPHPAVNFPIAA
jgi:hypothetical protein